MHFAKKACKKARTKGSKGNRAAEPRPQAAPAVSALA
jgi:hypothetical protein